MGRKTRRTTRDFLLQHGKELNHAACLSLSKSARWAGPYHFSGKYHGGKSWFDARLKSRGPTSFADTVLGSGSSKQRLGGLRPRLEPTQYSFVSAWTPGVVVFFISKSLWIWRESEMIWRSREFRILKKQVQGRKDMNKLLQSKKLMKRHLLKYPYNFNPLKNMSLEKRDRHRICCSMSTNSSSSAVCGVKKRRSARLGPFN